jgi:membrane associated rhomboid family serine protease
VMIFGDNLGRKRLPMATISIVVVTTFLFLVSTTSEQNQSYSFTTFSFVPLLFSLHPFLASYRLFSAIFLHLDLQHLLGNLVFLFPLGRAVESAIGSLTFLIAFIGLGALGFLGSWLTDPASSIPILGDSGAVSFVLGVYSMLFPLIKVRIVPFLNWPHLRAWVFTSLWLLLQTYEALTASVTGVSVAYWTHFVGFLIGLGAAAFWREFAEDTERRIRAVTGGNK